MTDYDAYYEDYVREDREDGVYLTPEMNKNILAKDGSIRYAQIDKDRQMKDKIR